MVEASADPLDAALAEGDELLARAVAGALARGRPEHPREWMLCRSAYDPWYAQRMLHRSTARWKFMICGRGAGKTFAATKEILDVVLAAPPGSTGAVLVPTASIHLKAVRAALEELAPKLPGVRWKVAERTMALPGNRSIVVYHAERKEKGEIRGPSIVMLWIDEGAAIPESYVNSATPALRSRDRSVLTRLLVTTTPMGKNWVYRSYDEAGLPENKGALERFRFRSTDSPYAADGFTLERCRRSMPPEFFAQEYLAEFVDSLLHVFEDFDAVLVDTPLVNNPKARCWLGVDLGKSQDWTVLTSMDEHAQGDVIDRWQAGAGGVSAEAFWRETDRRVVAHAKRLGAMVVIDVGGAGGSAGAVLAEKLRSEHGIPVLEVKTNILGIKAQIMEQLQADVAWRKIRVVRGPHTEQLAYEAGRMQVVQRVVHGQPVKLYEGPQLDGEHDDCVISLALANWGRVHDETPRDTGDGGLGALRPRGGSGAPASPRPRFGGGNVGRSGYMLR